ncbi:hypothetical protein [Pedobacter arcticus]|nr:hypothetical protein [Pedobacter arcticus]
MGGFDLGPKGFWIFMLVMALFGIVYGAIKIITGIYWLITHIHFLP